MKTVRTVCSRDCYDSCFLLAAVDDSGVATSVKGDPDDPFTRGFTCPRGKKDHIRIYKERILYPHIRDGKKPGRHFRRAEWSEALDLAAGRLDDTLRDSGRESVLLLDYAGFGGLLSTEFSHRLWNAIGAVRTDSAICSSSGHTALGLHYGSSYGLQPEEIVDHDLIVFWGFNSPVSSPHTWSLALEARKKNGAKIIAVDPRRSECARGADLWLAPGPGSDVALAMGVSRYLIEAGAVDFRFIEEKTLGFEELKAEASAWEPARVAEVTGIDPESLESIFRLYAGSESCSTLIGIGLQKNLFGADMVRAVSFIPALKGIHRGFFYTNGRAYLVDKDHLSGKSLCSEPGAKTSQVALSSRVDHGDFRFIFVYSTNPAQILPGQKALRRGLTNPDVFTVVHETHWTETTDYADVVLPATTFLEKRDIVLPWAHRRVRISEQAIEPLEESCDETWVMGELSRRLGLETRWLHEDPWQALEKAFEGSLEDGTFEDLLHGQDLHLRQKPRDEYRTPSGRIEFLSKEALESGFDPLPRYHGLEPADGEFILLNSASSRYTNTQFREVYGPIPAVVEMNPQDAVRAGVGRDDRVMLTNVLGAIELKVKLSDSVPSGVLWAPRQLTDLSGNPMNDITSSEPQPIGHGSTFNSTLVRLTRCRT